METYEQIKNEEYRLKTKALLDEMPDFCTGYANFLKEKQPRTRLSYLQDLRVFFEFLKQSNPEAESIDLDLLNRLCREDIVEYDNWLESYYMLDESGKEIHYTNSPSGRKRKLSSLRSFYSYLVNTAEYIENNPTLKVELPKVREKEIRTVESDELPLIFKAFELQYKNALKLLNDTEEEKQTERMKMAPAIIKRDLAIFSLFLGSGLRISELVGINTLDVKWDIARINIVRKGGKYDHIYVADEAFDAVSDYYSNFRDMFSDFDEEDALFLSSKHARITTRQVERCINKYISLALGENSGITCHKLRATFGTNYYRQTGDIYATATVLGHSSVETTKRHYAKVSERAKEQMRTVSIFNIEE